MATPPQKRLGPVKVSNSDRAPRFTTNLSQEDSEKFIRVWQTSNSVQDVAMKLGWKSTVASALAYRLRRAGVPLRSFKTRLSLNIESLKSIAEEYVGKSLSEAPPAPITKPKTVPRKLTE